MYFSADEFNDEQARDPYDRQRERELGFDDPAPIEREDPGIGTSRRKSMSGDWYVAGEPIALKPWGSDRG
jgi:hypothetical protein